MREAIIKTANDNTLLISMMTGLSSDQISEMIYREGMIYLRTILDGDATDVDMMSRSAHFWTWFKKLWWRCDRIFIHTFHLEDYKSSLDNNMREWLLIEYRAAHLGISIVYHPNRYIMKQGFQMQYRRAAMQREEAAV